MPPDAASISLGPTPWLSVVAIGGVGAGLWLLVRGMRGHVTGTRIADTSTSTIASIALGEVRVSGIIEPAELLLVSPLQSAPCVYYRARIDEEDDGSGRVLDEERAVGFRVRDHSGRLRVFPRGARFDVPDAFRDKTGSFGESPPGLRPRTGPALGPADPTREELVARLLTVQPLSDIGSEALGVGLLGGGVGSRDRTYREARLEPGEVVTILGRVVPFGELDDPSGADLDAAVGGPLSGFDDPEVVANIAEAREAGLLVGSAEEAWGNAAIPGFGIGRPTREPELDPGARPMPVAGEAEKERFERTFDLAPGSLVLAASTEVPLVISAGGPAEAVRRHQDQLVVGLLGGIMAIGSAVLLAASLSGMIGP